MLPIYAGVIILLILVIGARSLVAIKDAEKENKNKHKEPDTTE